MSKLKIALLAGVFVLLAAMFSQLLAQDSLTAKFLFPRRNQAGVRLGGWANLGDTPRRVSGTDQTFVETDFKGGSFYLEGYYAHRFKPWLMGEISLGIVNRGDVTVADGPDTFYGSLLIYPMTLRAKIYPFAKGIGSIFPYLTAGGGLYYGKHTIQFYESANNYNQISTGSKTKLSYIVGGGIDLPLASVVALEFSGQYMPVKFSGPVIPTTEIKDYSALTFTVGVKYLFANIKKSEDRARRGR